MCRYLKQQQTIFGGVVSPRTAKHQCLQIPSQFRWTSRLIKILTKLMLHSSSIQRFKNFNVWVLVVQAILNQCFDDMICVNFGQIKTLCCAARFC